MSSTTRKRSSANNKNAAIAPPTSSTQDRVRRGRKIIQTLLAQRKKALANARSSIANIEVRLMDGTFARSAKAKFDEENIDAQGWDDPKAYQEKLENDERAILKGLQEMVGRYCDEIEGLEAITDPTGPTYTGEIEETLINRLLNVVSDINLGLIKRADTERLCRLMAAIQRMQGQLINEMIERARHAKVADRRSDIHDVG